MYQLRQDDDRPDVVLRAGVLPLVLYVQVRAGDGVLTNYKCERGSESCPCSGYPGANRAHRTGYADGRKFCSVCGWYFKYDGLYCPCCGAMLRIRHRNSVSRKRADIIKAARESGADRGGGPIKRCGV